MFLVIKCVSILREAEDLPDCPPSIGGTGEDPVALLKEKLDEIWRHVARCRLLSARARDCVARGSADEASAAYDARGFGYSVYARTNADGTPKVVVKESNDGPLTLKQQARRDAERQLREKQQSAFEEERKAVNAVAERERVPLWAQRMQYYGGSSSKASAEYRAALAANSTSR